MMDEHQAQDPVPISAVSNTETENRDTTMPDISPEETVSPAAIQTLPNGNLEAAQETIVDSPANNNLLVNGINNTSFDGAASPLVGQDLGLSPGPQGAGTPNGNDARLQGTTVYPEAIAVGTGPTREYLNAKVVQHLLDGMKQLAREQPNDPLRVLGEFLLQRSREFEGTSETRAPGV
ncbi:compass complex subunit [Phlyctema vagabunda]|uniref:Compass complex subunit n=1 Tax=Phlyctema vagabunda TaxID=108571 RepID=A0ABR4PNN3_9HELO